MKKILGILLFAFIVPAFAAAPVAVGTGTAPDFSLDKTISASAAFDTLSSTDSLTLINKQTFDGGYEYVYAKGTITGGGTDSLKVQVVLDAFDGNNVFLARLAIDSITAADAEYIALPIGQTIFGSKYSLKAIGYTDNGGVVIFNRGYVYKRRAVTTTRAR